MAAGLSVLRRSWVGPSKCNTRELMHSLAASSDASPSCASRQIIGEARAELDVQLRSPAEVARNHRRILDVRRSSTGLISEAPSHTTTDQPKDSGFQNRAECVRARDPFSISASSLANITSSTAESTNVGPSEENAELRALLEIKKRVAQYGDPSESVISHRRSVVGPRSRSVVAEVGGVVATPAPSSRKGKRKRAKSPHDWTSMRIVLSRAHKCGQVTDHAHQILTAAIDAAATGQLTSPSDASTSCSPESASSIHDRSSELQFMTPGRCNLDDDDDAFLEDDDAIDECGSSGRVRAYTPWHCEPRRHSRQEVAPYCESDSVRREVGVRRSLLGGGRASGVGLGVVGRNPMERVANGDRAWYNRQRELMPLRLRTGVSPGESVYRDLSMPGVTEWVVKRSEKIFGREHPDAPVAELRKSISALSPDDRLSDGADLYKRLVRALDQRVPPNQRLFGGEEAGNNSCATKKNRKKSASSSTSTPSSSGCSSGRVKSYPIWMRAAASKLAYGRGSDIFRAPQIRPRGMPDGEIMM